MQYLLGWEPIVEDGNVIGLFDVTGGGAISLEPGGQFELSGAPVETVHQTSSELMAHLAQVKEVARPLGIGFLGLGMVRLVGVPSSSIESEPRRCARVPSSTTVTPFDATRCPISPAKAEVILRLKSPSSP